jgi:predicted  nucleic acid-binding Zn-ribbon protein
MSFLEAAHEVVKEAGGFLGVTSAGAVGWAIKKFKTVENNALEALKASGKALELIAKLEDNYRSSKTEVEAFRSKVDSEHNLLHASQPDLDDLDRRFIELQDRLDELRADNLRERGARHALQKEFSDYIKGETESWRDLHRSLGQIEGRLEIFLARK